MSQAALEVPEDQAEGKVKQYYQEIRSVLRVPFVGVAIRAIAVHGDYFSLAWQALKPNAQILYFEQVADQIRALAADAAASVGSAHGVAIPPDVSQRVRVLHYVLPKVFFGVTALRWATTGQQPVLVTLPREAKRQIVPGIPDGMDGTAFSTSVAALSESTDDWIADADRYLGSPGLRGEYATLWQWAQPIRAAWDPWWEYTRQIGAQSIPRTLAGMAEAGVTSLPFRMAISPHTLRLAGLSELQIDEVRSTLDEQYRFLSRQVAWIASLAVMIDGRDKACVSPFPPETR